MVTTSHPVVLAQAAGGQQVEGHGAHQVVLVGRADVGTVMFIADVVGQAQEIFLVHTASAL